MKIIIYDLLNHRFLKDIFVNKYANSNGVILWNGNIKLAYDFKDRLSAEKFAQERLIGLKSYLIVEIGNIHDIKPDPKDDGEDFPMKRPPARGRRGPRWSGGIPRLRPATVMRDDPQQHPTTYRARLPVPPTLPPDQAAQPHPPVMPYYNRGNLYGNIQDQPGFPAPGQMTEYGWFDAETENEITSYLMSHAYSTREEALIAVFNNM